MRDIDPDYDGDLIELFLGRADAYRDQAKDDPSWWQQQDEERQRREAEQGKEGAA